MDMPKLANVVAGNLSLLWGDLESQSALHLPVIVLVLKKLMRVFLSSVIFLDLVQTQMTEKE